MLHQAYDVNKYQGKKSLMQFDSDYLLINLMKSDSKIYEIKIDKCLRKV